jgi:hypothetical protein
MIEDFNSGAPMQNVVHRANTTNPADWLRISEKKDERIVYLGALDHYWTSSAARAGHRHRVEVGQYL